MIKKCCGNCEFLKAHRKVESFYCANSNIKNKAFDNALEIREKNKCEHFENSLILTLSQKRDMSKQDYPKWLTPIEFIDGNYKDREDVVVWWGDSLVYNIVPFDEDKDSYFIYYVNSDSRHRINEYSSSLRVEKIDYGSFKEQLMKIVDNMPKRYLLDELENFKQSYFRGEE